MFASFSVVPQCLSTIPFCSWCLGTAVLNFMLFSPHHFLNMSDLNSDPASDLILLMLFKFLSRQGKFDISCSIPSMHASDNLSLSSIALKILQYLSHNMRKWLTLGSFDIPIGSRLGTVSTWISSRFIYIWLSWFCSWMCWYLHSFAWYTYRIWAFYNKYVPINLPYFRCSWNIMIITKS